MKRRFTKILAALALLMGLMIPLGMWGQTRSNQVLTNANIVDAGIGDSGYKSWTITDDNSNEWNAYAIKNKHSNATSDYHYLQIKKYSSSTAYYIQVPELGTQITSITMTVSNSNQPMNGGGNSATLYFSNSSSTSSTGTGVASGTGQSSVTIDCSSLSLNTGYITASGAVRIWDVEVTYTTGPITYTVTYDCAEGTSGCPTENPSGLSQNEVITLASAPSKTGHTFGGWNDGNTTYAAGASYTVTGNVTMTAQWSVNTYGYTINITGEESHASVALYVEGEELQANDEISYEAEVTVSVITDDFYAYSISVKDASNNTVTFNTTTESFIMPASAVTITVNITEIPTWTVSFTTNGIADGTKQVIQGNAIGTLPEATAEYIPAGYTFVGWYNGDITEPIQTAPSFISPADPVNSDMTLKAVFAIASGSGSSDTYELVSNVNNLNDGDIIILVSTGSYKASGVTYYFTVANGTVNSENLMNYVDVTISENKVTSTDVAPITLVQVTGGWKLQMGTQYLNIVPTKNQIILDDEGAINTITITSDIATIGGITDGSDIRSIYYNPNSGNGRFAYYRSSQKEIAIYKQETSVTYSNYRTSLTESYTLTVTGYADYSAKDGYCLIASPVTVDPADVEGLVVANTDPNYQYFDLYSFANNQDEEWHNYKNTPFDLVPGTGYLYAKKATNEISTYSFELTGTPYSGDGEIELTQGTGNWADWNLVGNPYGVDAEIYNDCYVMNGNGSGITPAENHIVPAMHGVFVKYAEGEEVAIFEPIDSDGITSVQSENRLVLNLVRNRGTVIDRAIVRFGEGRQMTKFTLFENSTKLYIPQDDEDYAIVRSEVQGELPVSFRASENGTYTLSMNVENVDMNYLHLIDNMTGMDIDLLQTPSYTFEANTNDYANRFKLVFAANGTDEADESSFAFFSNGNLIVNNEGNATLQVIDINGRILSSETISGSCSKAINATTGVYMLRLINGDNVKVQKVVVR